MGNFLSWKRPILDEDQDPFDKIEVHRSATSGGSFSVIATIDITQLDYYDIDGASTDYYKIRYKNTSASKYSSYSSEMQAGTQAIYCGTKEVMDVIQQNTTTLPDNLSWDIVQMACQDASTDVDGITKTVHGRTAASTIQYFDSNTLSLGRIIQLDYRNVTVTEVALQYSTGVWTVLTSGISSDYEVKGPEGRVMMHWPLSKAEFSGFRDIRVTFTYGNSSVSNSVRLLAKYIAGIKLLVGLTGGSYNGAQSYSMGKVSYTIGNKPASLQTAITSLSSEAENTMNRMGLSLQRTAVRVH